MTKPALPKSGGVASLALTTRICALLEILFDDSPADLAELLLG